MGWKLWCLGGCGAIWAPEGELLGPCPQCGARGRLVTDELLADAMVTASEVVLLEWRRGIRGEGED